MVGIVGAAGWRRGRRRRGACRQRLPAPARPASGAGALEAFGTGQLAVSWRAPASNGAAVDDYDVQYRRVGQSAWDELPDNEKSTATTVTITGLTNGTEYEVRVRAENSVDPGLWSDSATATLGGAPSSRPLPPTVVAADGRLAVSWIAPASNGAEIDDYDVRYRVPNPNLPDDGPWDELPDNVKNTRTTATIGGLTNGLTYQVGSGHVRAVLTPWPRVERADTIRKGLLAVLIAWFSFASAGNLYAQPAALDQPLRAVHISGNWGHNPEAVEQWEADRTKPLLPLDYVEYLRVYARGLDRRLRRPACRRQHG